MPYDAGSIFLQVIPSYRNWVNQLQKDAPELARLSGKALFDDQDEWEKAAKRAGERSGKAFSDEFGKNGKSKADELFEPLNKPAEQSGKKAAEKYQGAFRTELKRGIEQTQRELKALKLDVDMDDEAAKAKVEELKAELKSLRKAKIGVDLDAGAAIARIAVVEKALGALRKDATVNLDFDLAAAEAGVAGFRKKLERLNDAANITLDANTALAERQIGAFEKSVKRRMKSAMDALGDSANRNVAQARAALASLGDADIGIDINGKAFAAHLAEIEAELAAVSAQDIDIQVRVDAAAAVAELAAVGAIVAAVDHDDVDVDVKARGAAEAAAEIGAVSAASRGAGNEAGSAAGAFRTFNAILLAAVTLGPGLVPILGAIAGGLLAIGPAAAGAGAGIAAMIIGFTGIQNAVQALSQAQKTSGKDATAHAKTMRSAAQSVADAERNLARAKIDAGRNMQDADRAVARARQDAARSVRDAIQQEQDAERNLVQAHQAVIKAEHDMVEARKKGIQEIQDLNAAVRDGALQERQGVVDLFQATINRRAVFADSGSTNLEREQADIAYQQAKNHLSDIRTQNKRNGDEKKHLDKTGVAGTDAVLQAQQQLTQALQQQRDAQLAVGRAAQAVNRARADGARSVADAERARDRAAQDNARQVQDAQRQLTRAQQDYQTALKQTGTIGSASMVNLRDAMSKLGPEGQKFARWIQGTILPGFYRIRNFIQQGMLPGVMDAANRVFSRYGPQFESFARELGRVLGGAFRMVGRVLTSPDMAKFFSMVRRTAPFFIRMFTKTALNWMMIFANLARAAAPLAMQMSRGLLHLSEGILKWTRSKKGQESMTHFFNWVAKIGPLVWRFLVNLVKALVNLGRALMPLGTLVLKGVTDFLGFIANMDPSLLGIIVEAVIGLIVAIQAAALSITLVSGAMAIMEAPFAVIVLIVAALAAAFVIAYIHSETFRKIVDRAWRGVVAVAKWAWNNVLHPIFNVMGAVFTWLWKHVFKPYLQALALEWKIVFLVLKWYWQHVLHPVFNALGAVFKWVWEHILRPAFKALGIEFRIIGTIFQWVWKHFLWPVLDLFGHIVGFVLWRMILKPTFKRIHDGWSALGDAWHKVWHDFIKPALDKFGDAMGALWRKVQSAVGKIKTAWNAVRGVIAKPINFVIKTVLNNGLIAGFNKIAKFVGSSPMPRITPIDEKSYATGGIMPGYTPGRDVHHFASPTGGMLHLSGGEAIMRPEVTRALGPAWVHEMNRRARMGGLAGVRRAVEGQAFAAGGIIDGKRLSNIAIKQIHLAEKLGHIHLHVMQGGYGGSHIQASGTSHNYPGVADISPGSAYVEKLLRRVGFAAWARNIPGRRIVGSGRHVHSVSLLDPGDSNSPQESSWAVHGDGMGGHDPVPHYPWVHNLAKLIGGSSLLGKVFGGIGSFVYHLPGWLGSILKRPFEWAKNKVEGPLKKLEHNAFTRLLSGTAHKLANGVGEKVKNLIGHFRHEKQAEMGTGPTGTGDLGAYIGGTVHATVKNVAKRYGWGGGAEWSALSKLITSESSWNPRAQNASSTAYGLFQFLDGTWAGVGGKKTSNPAAQSIYGMRYIKNRYGDPIHAWAYHRAHGTYKDGGILGDVIGPATKPVGGDGSAPADNGTMMYDNGGYLPPGLTTVLNLTGRPEPVFTADQFDSMRNGGGRAGTSFENNFYGTDVTASDVADELLFALKRHDNGGKYAGLGG